MMAWIDCFKQNLNEELDLSNEQINSIIAILHKSINTSINVNRIAELEYPFIRPTNPDTYTAVCNHNTIMFKLQNAIKKGFNIIHRDLSNNVVLNRKNQ